MRPDVDCTGCNLDDVSERSGEALNQLDRIAIGVGDPSDAELVVQKIMRLVHRRSAGGNKTGIRGISVRVLSECAVKADSTERVQFPSPKG